MIDVWQYNYDVNKNCYAAIKTNILRHILYGYEIIYKKCLLVSELI